MHQRGMAPDIHSQGTAPRLFNHPGQRLRSAVITGTTPGIPVDQQHQVIVFFTFALPKLPGPDVMQGCGMHAFTFPMLTFLVSVDSGFQGIDEAAGIAACLMAYSHHACRTENYAMTVHYYRLRDYALQHPECSAIMRIID